MLDAIILGHVTFVYFAAFVCYLITMVMGKEFFGRLATFITGLGFLSQTAAITLRWVKSYEMGIGHAPFSNMYESLIFYAWAIILFYLIVEWRTRNKTLGVFATPLAFLALAYATFGESNDIRPLIPALQSNWLITHVITCFFGYAAFALSFSLSIMYLIKYYHRPTDRRSPVSLIPDTALLEELNYQVVVIGFIMLTLGIMTGAVWGHYAWSRYWGWDAKETASLVTWMVYLTALHARRLPRWRGKRTAYLYIAGFLCVIFTYFGVSQISKLHGYAAKLY